MAAVEGETPDCLTRMAEKAMVSAPAIASARGRAVSAATKAGIVAGAEVRANPGQATGAAPRAPRCHAARCARPAAPDIALPRPARADTAAGDLAGSGASEGAPSAAAAGVVGACASPAAATTGQRASSRLQARM